MSNNDLKSISLAILSPLFTLFLHSIGNSWDIAPIFLPSFLSVLWACEPHAISLLPFSGPLLGGICLLLMPANELLPQLEFLEDVAAVVVVSVPYEEYEMNRVHHTISLVTKVKLGPYLPMLPLMSVSPFP